MFFVTKCISWLLDTHVASMKFQWDLLLKFCIHCFVTSVWQGHQHYYRIVSSNCFRRFNIIASRKPMPKLKNAPLSLEEYRAVETPKAARAAAKVALDLWYNGGEAPKAARAAAKVALGLWYEKGYSVANTMFPGEQQTANLSTIASMPDFCELKGKRNGYVMLCSMFDETPKPIVLVLDYQPWSTPSGGLSYRTLHLQVRASLKLAPNDTLRMIPFRPWYQYCTHRHPLRCRSIPATDVQCRYLLGTTLMYYAETTIQHRRSSVLWLSAGNQWTRICLNVLAALVWPAGGSWIQCLSSFIALLKWFFRGVVIALVCAALVGAPSGFVSHFM